MSWAKFYKYTVTQAKSKPNNATECKDPAVLRQTYLDYKYVTQGEKSDLHIS